MHVVKKKVLLVRSKVVMLITLIIDYALTKLSYASPYIFYEMNRFNYVTLNFREEIVLFVTIKWGASNC